MPLWPKRQLLFMAKAELFNPILGPPLRAGGAFPVRRGEADMEAIEAAVELCRGGGVVAMFPEGTRQRKGLRKKFEHKPRPGSARIALDGGRAARARGDQGHGPAVATAEAPGRLRRAGPGGRPRREAAAAGPPARHRTADGARLRAVRGAMSTAAARDRRRLARSPRLPRAAEVDEERDRQAVGRARRVRQLHAPALGGGAAARRRRRLGHDRGADVPARGVSLVPERPGVRRGPARAARPAARARAGGRLLRARKAPATRPTTSWPRRWRGGGARRDNARRHLGPRRLPARSERTTSSSR